MINKWNVLTIIMAICNFIIAFTNYFHAISSHDAYYMSEAIFNLIIGLGIILINKKD